MKLQSCNIRLLASYEPNAGQYQATITYEDKRGQEVKMILTPEISEQLLGFVGPAITRFAHIAALEVERNIMLSVEESQKGKAIDLPRTEAV